MRQRLAHLSVLRWVSVSPERTGTGRTGRLIPHCFRGPAPEPDPQPHGDAPDACPLPDRRGKAPCSAPPGPLPWPRSPVGRCSRRSLHLPCYLRRKGPACCAHECAHALARSPCLAASDSALPTTRVALGLPPGSLHGLQESRGEGIRPPSSTRGRSHRMPSHSTRGLFPTGLRHRSLNKLLPRARTSSASRDCNTDPQAPFPRLQPRAN